MDEPRVCVLRAAGVNCNEETAYAFELAGATAKQIHVNRLLEAPGLLDGFGAVAVPGGFSYGDDIAGGKVLAVEVGQTLGEAFQRLLERGGLVLGICNGFQVLIKSGLLPGPEVGRDVRCSPTLGSRRSSWHPGRCHRPGLRVAGQHQERPGSDTNPWNGEHHHGRRGA